MKKLSKKKTFPQEIYEMTYNLCVKRLKYPKEVAKLWAKQSMKAWADAEKEVNRNSKPMGDFRKFK